MDQAIDLFLGGTSVPAGGTNHAAVASMRMVCPQCIERVHLVVRADTSYFAHEPLTEDSPPCSLRSELRRDTTPDKTRRTLDSIEPLPPNTRFRDALLAAYSLTEPPEPPATGASIAEAVAVMHRAFRDGGRTVSAADFPDASIFVQNMWANDATMIRGFLERPGVLSGKLREDLRDDPELQGDEHRRSALLLWRHLHHPQVAEDLRLLLRVTAQLFRPALLAELVVTSLGVLAWVHWTRLFAALEHECDDCRKHFAEKPAACTECWKRSLCPDCAIPCSGCHDIMCEHCIYGSCEACSSVLCMTCSHNQWPCTSCQEWFCEGGLDEQPEEVDKIECEGCNEPFCGDCAKKALQDWEGDSLCETCREERESEQDETT